jgi:hypothetical protein
MTKRARWPYREFMANFWLGAVAGAAAVAVASVWLVFWLHRRHLAMLEVAAIRLEAVQRAHYESDLRWRRRATEWDQFAGQVLSTSDQFHQGQLLRLLPSHSALRRD